MLYAVNNALAENTATPGNNSVHIISSGRAVSLFFNNHEKHALEFFALLPGRGT